jgi:hypothetical protein
MLPSRQKRREETMADYWVTFRIASDKTYDDRYNGMLKAMVALRGQNASWGEPTSFWLVQSASALDAFTKALGAPLNAKPIYSSSET